MKATKATTQTTVYIAFTSKIEMCCHRMYLSSSHLYTSDRSFDTTHHQGSKVKLEELEKKARYEQYQVLPLINLHGVENDQIREVRDGVRYMNQFSMCTATQYWKVVFKPL